MSLLFHFVVGIIIMYSGLKCASVASVWSVCLAIRLKQWGRVAAGWGWGVAVMLGVTFNVETAS